MSGPADRSTWWLALAGAIGVVAGAAITGTFNYLGHKGDVDAKMIELGVGILRTKPTPETMPLREWAIDVIDKRAGFKFNEAQRAALLEKELPFKGGFVSAPFGGRELGNFDGGIGDGGGCCPPNSNSTGKIPR
jgi:hypothetical protein